MSATNILPYKPTNNHQQPTIAPEVLVRVEGASKKFCRSLKKSLWYGIQDIARELNPFGRETPAGERQFSHGSRTPKLRDDEFWAVNDVSFELRRGECLGLIGHNGAGKTTLLKMLNGLIKPDKGRIEMRGRVGALIALGAGFNPILTGRENIFVNASILGLNRHEIERNIDEIIEFAELSKSIDSPVQSYSSGMTVRLGFAVATTLKPDILILDEVLAVGDMAFQAKCLQRIGQIRKSGVALIFVSHNTHQMSMVCERGIVLNQGSLVEDSEIRKALETYENNTRKASLLPENASDWASDGFEIELAGFSGTQVGPNGRSITPRSPFQLEFSVNNLLDYPQAVILDTRIEDSYGTLLQCSSGSREMQLSSGGNIVAFQFGGLAQHGEHVRINVALWSREDKSIIAWSRGHKLFISRNSGVSGREDCEVSFRISKC